ARNVTGVQTCALPIYHAGKGWGVRWSIWQHQVVPELGADDAGGLGRATLPGLVSVGWRRRKRMMLIGPWQRSDHGAFGRAAALTAVYRQGGTPGGKVGRSATDIPRDPSRLDLR